MMARSMAFVPVLSWMTGGKGVCKANMQTLERIGAGPARIISLGKGAI